MTAIELRDELNKVIEQGHGNLPACWGVDQCEFQTVKIEGGHMVRGGAEWTEKMRVAIE